MDIRGFQVWLSAARGLTRAPRREALAVLSGRSEGAASKAAIELGVDEARRCPHCSSEGAVSRGMARGLRRYQCKGCGRTFNALSGTPLSGLHHKERWLSFGASLAKGETVKASAARCDVAVSTAFRWRHRFLAAARSDSEVLKGIVEADETYVLESRKGARGLGRKARRRGGKAKKRGLSREQVPVLMAADRSGTTVSAVLPRVDAAALTAALDPVVAKDALLVSDGGASYPPCAAALGVSHEALNRSMGERVRGDLHVQTVNSRHSRLKDFLRPRRGIATRYLDNYLSWFHLVGLAPGANVRACLAAAITRWRIRFNNRALYFRQRVSRPCSRRYPVPMFIRRARTRTTASGEAYFSYRLVRSERSGDRVRQRTLLNLGSDFPLGREQWSTLCARIEQLLDPQAAVIPLSCPRGGLLCCDGTDLGTPVEMARITTCDEAGKGTDGRQALIACLDTASPIVLQVRQELQYPLYRQVFHGQSVHWLAHLTADEWKQQFEAVAIACLCVPRQISFGNDVLREKPFQPRGEGSDFTHGDLRRCGLQHGHQTRSVRSVVKPLEATPGS